MEKKMKVVWLCSFMNQVIRDNVHFRIPIYERIARKLLHLKSDVNEQDFAIWDTNAINEASKRDDIEVFVVFPLCNIGKKVVRFDYANVHYIGYRCVEDFFIIRILHQLGFRKSFVRYNHIQISKIIRKISPDIIHVFGAENYQYSGAVCNIRYECPVIVQLQTLINDPVFKGNYVYTDKQYEKQCENERKVLAKADYIGDKNEKYRDIIRRIVVNPKFVDTMLAIAPELNKEHTDKLYDMVYFSANINKAFDIVVEAIGILTKVLPEVKCLVVGNYDRTYKETMDQRIGELDLIDNFEFTGSLPTHDDVINKVKQAKVAFLPLKVDLISSTIREAMACGIPVVSTITDGTPALNNETKTVLLSDKEDYKGMADNLYSVLTDDTLYSILSKNSFKYIEDHYSNRIIVQKWVDSYKNVVYKSDMENYN